jgi:hypothetical protein
MPKITRHVCCKPGERCTLVVTVDPVHLTPRPRQGYGYGLDVIINSPAPGGTMSAGNPQASGTATGASSITVTLEPSGSILTVAGGLTQPLPNWQWTFQPGISPGSYVLTAEVYDLYGNTVSESISVTVTNP